MNYRHAFHAGNFADVLKHAGLVLLIRSLTTAPEPLTVLETHAGAGRYELGAEAERTGEAARGVAVLLEEPRPPKAFAPYLRIVRGLNPDGTFTAYPGSPVIAARLLRPQDRYVGAEVQEEDHAALRRALMARANAEAVHGDGWTLATSRLKRGDRTLILCDPPFERGDDHASAARLVRDALRVENRAVVAVWLPIKDLETFDGFLREVEGLQPPSTLVAEVRLRPLVDPMRLNGCALAIVNAPAEIDAGMEAVCGWIAERLGEDGALGRIARIGAAPG